MSIDHGLDSENEKSYVFLNATLSSNASWNTVDDWEVHRSASTPKNLKQNPAESGRHFFLKQQKIFFLKRFGSQLFEF